MKKSIKINKTNKEVTNADQIVTTRCASIVKKTMMSIFYGGALLIASSASAGILPSDISVFAQAEELSDNFLGNMRGKFVSSGNIMYFGVEMSTQWRTSVGETITATANLDVNLSNNEPQVTFTPNITTEQDNTLQTATINGTSEVGGAGALDGVSGVVQNIQVAGTSNGIANSIGMNVQRLSGPSINQPTGVTSDKSMSVQTVSGSTATVSMANNALGVSVVVPNQGQTTQQIRSLAMGGGQVMQSVQLGGDQNQIRNMINLTVQMNALSSTMNARTGDVLTAMRMLPQVN
tara:strand:+ start:4976 stop:5851 length:876 start_codon:yes stop_codon:yes gene_type:complete